MTILFIGDTPSSKNTDPSQAFVGTESHKTLLKWCKTIGVTMPLFSNRIDRGLQRRLQTANANGIPVVALGKLAQKDLQSMGINCFSLPHPSGLNRQLNDKFELELLLESCRDWAETFSTEDWEKYAE